MNRIGAVGRVVVAAAWVALAGCGDDAPSACNSGVTADRALGGLTIAATGGFDDWGSAGAAFAYAVDATNELTVVTALAFQLPLYSAEFTPRCDPLESATAYTVAVSAPSGVDVTTYPILRAALADTNGIRALAAADRGAVLVLLAGDPTVETPARIYVAEAGSVTLIRNDGGTDTIVAHDLQFREVDGLGSGASVVASGEVVRIAQLVFDWATPGMAL